MLAAHGQHITQYPVDDDGQEARTVRTKAGVTLKGDRSMTEVQEQTLKAESREEDRVKDENYLRRELRVGSYRRSIHLPGGLETDDVDADYEDGILRLEFPKTEEAKARTIKVKPK